MNARTFWLWLPLLPVVLLTILVPFSCSLDDAWQDASYGHFLWQHHDGTRFYLLPEVAFTLPPEDEVTHLEISRPPWVSGEQRLSLEVIVDGNTRFAGDLPANTPILIPIGESDRKVKIHSDGILQHFPSPTTAMVTRLTLIGLRAGNESGWLPPEHWRLRRAQLSDGF